VFGGARPLMQMQNGRRQKRLTGILVQDAPRCILCGREGSLLYSGLRDRLFGVPGTWSLMRCQACDLVWLNPRPLPTEVEKLYEDYYTHSVLYDNTDKVKALVKSSVLRTSYGYEVDGAKPLLGRLLSRLGPIQEAVGAAVLWLHARERGRLLDVGCGNGQFLARMRELGWEVMGVEPDPEAVRIARERFGLEVVQGTLEEAGLSEGSFDVITMNHVIEHVPDPVATLSECRRLLRPGGKLIVVTPNTRSLGRRLFGEHWRGWEVPRHLFVFSPRSLRACAERAGLTVRRLWTASKVARWMWVVSRLLRRDGRLPGGDPPEVALGWRLQGFAFWGLEYILTRLWPVGEELVLEAGK